MLKVQEVKETIITQNWVRATQHAMTLMVLRVNTTKTASNVDVLIFNNLYIKEIKKDPSFSLTRLIFCPSIALLLCLFAYSLDLWRTEARYHFHLTADFLCERFVFFLFVRLVKLFLKLRRSYVNLSKFDDNMSKGYPDPRNVVRSKLLYILMVDI